MSANSPVSGTTGQNIQEFNKWQTTSAGTVFKQFGPPCISTTIKRLKHQKTYFFNIRPGFEMITKEFLKVSATLFNCVHEVMVVHKGTVAGNLYIANKQDRWGYKLFCRAGVDRIIYDILMY